jgi:hypothetical protein
METRANRKRAATPSASEPIPPAPQPSQTGTLVQNEEEVEVEDRSDDPADKQAVHSRDNPYLRSPLRPMGLSVVTDNDVVGTSRQPPPTPHTNLGMPRPPAPPPAPPGPQPAVVPRQQVTFDQHSAEEDFDHTQAELRWLKRPVSQQISFGNDEDGSEGLASSALELQLRNILAQIEILQRYKRNLYAKRRHVESASPSLQAQVHEAGLRLKALQW